jgi:glycerol-3-phosphate dehydrogenase
LEILVRDYGIPEPTAKQLSQKFGTNASKVPQLAGEGLRLATPIIPGLAPLLAEVAYSARNEMAWSKLSWP